MNVNAYQVMKHPQMKIHQYDVIIGNGAEKRIVQRKVWKSKARSAATGPEMLYDGSRLGWSLKFHNDIRVMVDLDVEEGLPPSPDGRNVFRLHIKKTKDLNPSIIQAFLDGKVEMSDDVAEAIMFMDHLLRETPSNSPLFVAVRRSLFKRQGQRADLGGSIEVWRGIYQSMRLAQGHKLIINLDVANSCFWKPQSLLSAIVNKWREVRDPNDLANRIKAQDRSGRLPNEFHRNLNKSFKGIEVKAVYKGNLMPNKTWKILRIDSANANEHRIEWKDPNTKKGTGEMISLAQYFRRKYNLTVQHSNLPLVEMTKKNVRFPLEFLQVLEGQRYAQKLDETQTANMIKFAVSRPAQRLQSINEGKGWLNWENDPYLKGYGLHINPEQIQTKATILPPPGIQFGNMVEQPGTRGRWDLKGKRFLNCNPEELVSWGIGMFTGRIKADKSKIDHFALDFARAYRSHGGRVANSPPHIMSLPPDTGAAVAALHQETGNKFKRRPQLLIFLVQDKNSFNYLRIKKSCDCRFGIVSQVMQIQQVLKGNPQYYSNVLMKVNAKLGGTTSQAKPSSQSGFKGFNVPTMIVGADVSHASPGSEQPSTAAITVSFDRFGGRYAATCQTNGFRVEMISEANWNGQFKPLVRQWMSTVGGGRAPQQVYYIRDGVSEGQFIQVLQSEVAYIKAVLNDVTNGQWQGKMTTVIASKRHHIRAFPVMDGSDQHGNPLPGTLIERDVTTPNEFDFYLYSHIALQGTSRPVHYSILQDEANHKPEQIQNMIYEHCYQYMRSTTSVSLHPAAYYAHLASNRCKAHEDIPATQGPQGGAGFKQQAPSRSSEPSDSEAKPLMPLFNVAGINYAMWYI
jgi:eukaryotic translation initiation factor 2C